MGINRKYKDRIFCMLFGYPKYKKNLLELFNALNGTNYEDENELEINTIEDTIYMGMKNDVSCIIQSNMAMYEQQSTWNPNMPLRGILYSARLFSKYIKTNELNIYNEKLIKIPTPQYYVFYNGKKKIGDKVILKLSDAFSAPQNEGQFEWTATVLNINEGHNEELLSKCKILREYAIIVKNSTDYPINKGFSVLFVVYAYHNRTIIVVITLIFPQLRFVCWGINVHMCLMLLLRFRAPVCQL